MITITRLKEALKHFPDNALVHAYEGEATGLTINVGEQWGFIHACADDDCAQCKSGEIVEVDERRE